MLHLFFALIASCVFSISPSTQEKILTINILPYYEDKTRQLAFEEVFAERKSLFKLNPEYKPAMYDRSSAYWVELDFCVEGSKSEFLLEFYDQTIDSISLYLSKDGGPFEAYAFGAQYDFSEKDFGHKNFQVHLGNRGKYKAYARIVNRNYSDIRVAIRTINRFVSYAVNEYYLYGLFYGMILIISLYNLSIFSAIREIKYLYYTFYILSVGLFAMCMDGIAYQYLWPESPDWNHIAHGVALFSVIFWSIVFSKEFLGLKTRMPKINAVLNWVLVVRGLIFLYALLVDSRVFNFRNIEIIPLSIIFFGSIYTFRKGYKPARFFIVAYGFLFFGFLIKALIMSSVIPFRAISYSQTLQILSYYSLHICFLLEMLFLSIALSDRIRILKETKDKAQRRIIEQHIENADLKDKVNKELEEKIAQRTQELEQKNLLLAETNYKLTRQTEEIGRINSKLDLDNWKLRNNIKEILQDRLINKNLSFEQFQDIFPNELACLKFLERLKWGNGFKCVKCSNQKYSDGNIKFSRRCSKCGYTESLTSNTIFHRVKFPLRKAFYILYVVSNHQDDFTIDELSELLDLRRNTVWSFRKKIEDLHQDKNTKSSKLLLHFFDSHLN